MILPSNQITHEHLQKTQAEQESTKTYNSRIETIGSQKLTFSSHESDKTEQQFNS